VQARVPGVFGTFEEVDLAGWGTERSRFKAHVAHMNF